MSSTAASRTSSVGDINIDDIELKTLRCPHTWVEQENKTKFIQIIGYSGCGKSTLAKRLAEHYEIPMLHLDNVHWHGDWEERPHTEEEWLIRAFLHENEERGWVIDGDYFNAATERFYRANLTILLDFNRFWCWWSCFKRWKEWKGRSRGTCPCAEKFDWEFQKWILWSSRGRKVVEEHDRIMGNGRGEKLRFKSRKELMAWLDKWEKEEKKGDESFEHRVTMV